MIPSPNIRREIQIKGRESALATIAAVTQGKRAAAAARKAADVAAQSYRELLASFAVRHEVRSTPEVSEDEDERKDSTRSSARSPSPSEAGAAEHQPRGAPPRTVLVIANSPGGAPIAEAQREAGGYAALGAADDSVALDASDA